MCDECCEPFCAGRVECFQDMESRPGSLRCFACRWSAHMFSGNRCLKHDHKFAIFKCDFCCDVAVWSCHSGHYCERCHNGETVDHPCPGPGLCPLGIPHPPNLTVHTGDPAQGFVIGCAACLGCTDAVADALYVHYDYGYYDDYDDFLPDDDPISNIDDFQLAKDG